MIARVFERGARGGEARGVGGVDVTATFEIERLGFGVGFDRNRLVADVVLAEEVRQVQLGRGAGLDADGRAIEFLGRADPHVLGNHEALTVIVVHADEFELQVDIAREGPGGVAGQQIDLARGQRGKPRLAGGGDEFDGRRIVQHGGGDGAADADVKTVPVAVGVGGGKAHQARRHATVERAACLDVIQRSCGGCASSKTGDRQRAKEYGFFHDYLFLFFEPPCHSSGLGLPRGTPHSCKEASLPNGPSVGGFPQKRQA